MKKQIMLAVVAGLLFAAPAVMADEGNPIPKTICPFTTLAKADELKLSKKQIEEVEKVKEEALGMMSKIDGEMKAILSKGQVKKYEKLTTPCDGSKCKMKHVKK